MAADPRHPITQPVYPPAAVRRGLEGIVELELQISTEGRVQQARVRVSSGSAELDRAAVDEALRAWRWLPARRGDQPVESTHRIRVTFRLDQR